MRPRELPPSSIRWVFRMALPRTRERRPRGIRPTSPASSNDLGLCSPESQARAAPRRAPITAGLTCVDHSTAATGSDRRQPTSPRRLAEVNGSAAAERSRSPSRPSSGAPRSPRRVSRAAGVLAAHTRSRSGPSGCAERPRARAPWERRSGAPIGSADHERPARNRGARVGFAALIAPGRARSTAWRRTRSTSLPAPRSASPASRAIARRSRRP